MALRFIISIALLLSLCSGAQGRTITLARDGSGEFSILQHALDAAASGDTILVGPGEYTEMFPVKYPGYAWDVEVAGHVTVSELTIIGAGPEVTIIGQANQNIDYVHYSPIALGWDGGVSCRIENATLRNSFHGFLAFDGPIFVNNCRFVDNVEGLWWINVGSGGWVKNSTFYTSYVSSHALLNMYGTGGGALVDNCIFSDAPHGYAVLLSGVDDIAINNCEIFNARIGVQISAGAGCLIRDTRIHDCEFYGLTMTAVAPRCEIRDSEISGGKMAVWVDAEGVLAATQTIFTGGTTGVMKFVNTAPAYVRYCDLIKGSSAYSIDCVQLVDYGNMQHDFLGNYWGTGDAALIASWIHDIHDDPAILAEVLYTPFYGGPVDTETTSWGDLKALWR
ncbi:right-handed parallel beta-helix repeat-containing protein [bacterium]|nr:right-handed parallel beta-helix repeat-containing protein [bacterium]